MCLGCFIEERAAAGSDASPTHFSAKLGNGDRQPHVSERGSEEREREEICE